MREWIKLRYGLVTGWLRENWLSHHLALLPLGTLATTWILLCITGAGSNWWSDPQSLLLAGQVAPFGAAIYGSLILPIEILVRTMFWAIQQVLKQNDKIRKDERRRLIQKLLDQGELPLSLQKEAEELGLTLPALATHN